MTEPVADLRHLSTRLPENEQGGDPQTGEGAVRIDERAGDQVAGDPEFVLSLNQVREQFRPALDALNAGPEQAPEAPPAPVTEPSAPEQPASVPLIPADQPEQPAAPQE